MLILDNGVAIVTDVRELAAIAASVGMEVPERPDNFHAAEYPHFSIYVQMQLCGALPIGSKNYLVDNAKMIASIPDEKVFEVTLDEIRKKGFY